MKNTLKNTSGTVVTPGFGLSDIWTPDNGITWSWQNWLGEGCGYESWSAALQDAEEALKDCSNKKSKKIFKL